MQFAEGNAIKYICRHQKKGGKQDLEKAKHYIDMIIERDYGDDTYRSQTFEVTLPNDLSIIEGGKDIRYVVEVEAGTARLINLSEGAFLRSNRFGLEAAWPC